MALTPTTQIELGFTAPDFNLKDTSSSSVNYETISGEKGTVVMFICNHCPYVIHVIDEVVKIANEYQTKGIGFVAINSNDVSNYPEDSPEKMIEFHSKHNFTFPYLFDEDQTIAKAYEAACTPDISVFNNENKCIYRGQLDESTPGNDKPNNGASLRKVLDYLLENKSLDFEQKPSLGCNIKWKKE